MKPTLHRLLHWFGPPLGNGARDVLAFLMLGYGASYLLTGSSLRSVNVFPMRLYGALLLCAGLMLLLTRNCKRLSWQGRAAALSAFALWFLIVVDAWGAWVSISGAAVLAVVAFNEARVHAC